MRNISKMVVCHTNMYVYKQDSFSTQMCLKMNMMGHWGRLVGRYSR
jgi:hypothetical protein